MELWERGYSRGKTDKEESGPTRKDKRGMEQDFCRKKRCREKQKSTARKRAEFFKRHFLKILKNHLKSF